jgi:hypothetical protein
MELLHCRAEAEFRGDVACAARRSFLVTHFFQTTRLISIKFSQSIFFSNAITQGNYFRTISTIQAIFVQHTTPERACQRAFTVRANSPPRTRQLILAGVEVRELGEQPNLGWDAACQQGIRSPFRARIRKHTHLTLHTRAIRTTTRSKGGEYKKMPTRATLTGSLEAPSHSQFDDCEVHRLTPCPRRHCTTDNS